MSEAKKLFEKLVDYLNEDRYQFVRDNIGDDIKNEEKIKSLENEWNDGEGGILLTSVEERASIEGSRLNQDAEQARKIAEVANAHGWNGVENSKVLSVFVESELGKNKKQGELIFTLLGACEEAHRHLVKTHKMRPLTPPAASAIDRLANAIAEAKKVNN